MNRLTITLLTAASLALASGGQCQETRNPHERAMERVRALSDSEYVRLLPFGKSHQDRSIPAFVISDFSKEPSKKARILICSGQHGDEPSPVTSVLTLCEDLASGGRSNLLAKCMFIVAPVVNPDGSAASERSNGHGVDINRDWMALATREARYVDGIIRSWKPHVLIDAHEWTGQSNVTGNGIEVPRCPLPSQKRAVGRLAEDAGHQSGLKPIACSSRSDKRLFHRRYALLGYGAYLLETAAGESDAAKTRRYNSAIVAIADALARDRRVRGELSPASERFELAAVSSYLENAPAEQETLVCSAFPLTMMMLGVYCFLVWVMRPAARQEQIRWSRRFTRCLVEGDVEIHPLARGRNVPHPITAKSWINRRLRTRHVPEGGRR